MRELQIISLSATQYGARPLPKLISVDVEKLLGRFDHHFDFPSSWEFVILHGPNGIGKTRLLELIDALHRPKRLHRITAMPFAFASLNYDDGSQLTVSRGDQLSIPDLPEGERPVREALIVLTRPGEDRVEFVVSPQSLHSRGPNVRHFIESELPLSRVGMDHWVDHNYGDRITTDEVIERYAVEFPPQYLDHEDANNPAFRAFVEDVPVYLIETQRLLPPAAYRARRGPASDEPLMTVLRYSKDLSQRISEALAENSTTSQRLDRTFPRRVLTAPEPSVTDEQIREKYAEQGRLRDRLTAVSLLDAETGDLPLPERALEDWQRRVLWTYLTDTEQKLATFQPLLARAQLLQEIVNARFLFKDFRIVREGFRFTTDHGGELGPAALSSGEQHELVLAYDLLFNVDPQSLVLIDEPEISLHVSWQQQFLNDLSKISKLQSLRFIIATHSPQIIHKWWDRAEALYEDLAVEPDEQSLRAADHLDL